MDNKERDADIVKRYLAKETLGSIKERYKISRQRIYQIVDEAGVHRPHVYHKTEYVPGEKYSMSQKQIDEAIRDYELGGKSWTEIAKQYPCSRGTVYRLCTNKRPDLRKHHED